jgi:endoglycosylceramidase
MRRNPRPIGRAGLLVAGLVALTLAPAPAGAALRSDGTKLLDGRGREVVLHGTNVVYKVPPYHPNDAHGLESSFRAADARLMRRWGFNTVRLGVTWAGLAPERGEVNAAYVAELERLARLLGRFGMHVLVDMHQDGWSAKYGGNGAPDWATYDDGLPWAPQVPHPSEYGNPAVGRAFTSFWQNREGIRDAYVDAFATLAREMSDVEAVFGYDIFNEPSCEYTAPPCAFPPAPEAAGVLLQPFIDQIVPALRQADPGAVVFYEDWITASSAPFSVGEPPNEPLDHPDLGLSYHVYCAASDCETGERQTMRWAKENGAANEAFPLITEFGATDDVATIERVARLADEEGQSWQYWTYKTYFDPYPIFGVPPAVAEETGQDDTWSIVDETGKVKERKVEALARPYPMAIAGRDAEWGFDPQTKEFAFSYSPTGRAKTIVSVPARVQYPEGFEVDATGARVTERRRPSRLTLRAEPGAERVELRVGPRGATEGGGDG